jgi:hypothetical protein
MPAPRRQRPRTRFSSARPPVLPSKLLSLPAINSEDADYSPSRIAPRNVFGMALGDDNIVHFGQNERFRLRQQ